MGEPVSDRTALHKGPTARTVRLFSVWTERGLLHTKVPIRDCPSRSDFLTDDFLGFRALRGSGPVVPYKRPTPAGQSTDGS
jgi:hypothetical protein